MNKLFDFPSRKLWLDFLFQEFENFLNINSGLKRRINIALSGGNTPADFYTLIAHNISLNSEILQNINWWIVDERNVELLSTERNEKMLRMTLGSTGLLSEQNFFSWGNLENPSNAASNYAEKLSVILGDNPSFDLVILGMGQDGHTASLFPNSSGMQEKNKLAIANSVSINGINALRFTITFPVINNAKQVWFLVSGQEKRLVVNQLVRQDNSIPAGHVRVENCKIFYSLS